MSYFSNSKKSFSLICKGEGRSKEVYYEGTHTTLDQAIKQQKAKGLQVVTVHHYC